MDNGGRDSAESDPGRGDGSSERADDDEAAPSITAASDLARVLSSSSLKQSLGNSGAAVGDPMRPTKSVPSAMLERFLRVAQLSSLKDLNFSQCIGLWGMAKDVKNEMVAASGVARDWKTLCPSALWECNWALEVGPSAAEAVADRRSLFPPRHPRVKCSIDSRKVGLVVAFALSPFWNLAVRQYFNANPLEAQEEHPASDDGSAEAPHAAVDGRDRPLAAPRPPAHDGDVLCPRSPPPSDKGPATVDQTPPGAERPRQGVYFTSLCRA